MEAFKRRRTELITIRVTPATKRFLAGLGENHKYYGLGRRSPSTVAYNLIFHGIEAKLKDKHNTVTIRDIMQALG
jgi:hypothetical protein